MTQAEAILDLIGPEAMQRLCDEFGGLSLYIPKAPPDPERDNVMRIMFSNALKGGSTCMNSYSFIANEFGMSVRRVIDIVNKRR